MTDTEFFYRVTEYVTTFNKDKGANEPFENVTEFKDHNLSKCRDEAVKWYNDRLAGLEKEGKYFLPFASPKDFKEGENAAFSINLALVEVSLVEDSEVVEIEHYLAGESEEDIQEGREQEEMLFKALALRQSGQN